VVKLMVAVTMTLAVVAGVDWLGQGAVPGVPERTAVIRVGAGETIWDVAARVAPGSDQRAVVDRIRQLNGLTSGEVVPDQQLQLPDAR
jgi:predicted Zn-dependent protease